MGQALFVDGQSANERGFGAHMARCFGLPTPPMHVRRTGKRGLMAVTEIRSVVPSSDPTPPLGYDEAYMAAVHLRSFQRELWLDGKFAVAGPIHAGNTQIIDLRRDPRALVKNAIHSVQFYLPLATIRAYAEQNEMPGFTELAPPSPVGDDDPVMRHLTHAAAATMADPHRPSSCVLDAILDAVCTHILERYGSRRASGNAPRRGLAPWQERRAKEVMNERLDATVAEVAHEVGLSTGHFSRAFKRSTGTAPHQWQIARRVGQAQALLSDSRLPIAEIALACGFSSQSHFQARFKQATGTSPGRWRRSGPDRYDEGGV